jgi:phosphatidylinositol kinase/protein kinase (PI-3  family)
MVSSLCCLCSLLIGHVLNEFVRTCALPYLEDDSSEVRKAAAVTCCLLFVKDTICYQASSHAIEIISDVLDKLLTVGIADPGIISCPIEEKWIRIYLIHSYRRKYPTDCSILPT